MRRRFGPTLLALCATAALALTACGTTEPAADQTTAAATTAQESAATSDAGASSSAATSGAGTSAASSSRATGPITVTDARGKEVELDGPAVRVVGTEWNVVEHLVSLDVMPVGVADVEGYTAWVTAAPLDDTVKDIGVRGEPSIDSVAALDPDLILATTDLPDGAVAQLEKIAPVVALASADASDQLGQMRENIETTGTLVGKPEQAQELLAEYDATVADGAAALEQAGLAGNEFMFADGWISGGAVSVRPYAKGSLISDVTEELGLVNGWPEEGDPAYGLGQTDVEGLTQVGDVHFMYITNGAEQDAFGAEGLADNPIWKQLTFVKNDQVDRLPDGIWMFGGPASMIQYVDAVVAALAS